MQTREVQPRLLKVPRWLSDIWKNSPPEEIVAKLDPAAGKLYLLRNDGCERPVALDIQTREAPELFAFTKVTSSDSAAQGTVLGSISESIHIKANPNDQAYKAMLQRRAEEGVNAGNRTVLTSQVMFDSWDVALPEEARVLDRQQRAQHAENVKYVAPDVKAPTQRAFTVLPKELRDEVLGNSGPASESERMKTAKQWGPGSGATTAPMFKKQRLQV
mmetsp:Transcript_65056/g.121194  ORF Transcript_65056/g.121194 Transcript_65056/m.121194 type:complete len:217 (-) Transcript_65056:65-715(-)